MAASQSDTVLRHIHDLVATQQAATLLDCDLLDRFTHARDEAAFEALVRRHGPLVLGVCRRVLGNFQDAEDAFQATFLVLARKAASICKHSSLSSWLYQVAYRVALKGRSRGAAQRRREQRPDPRVTANPLEELTAQELLASLDQELHRLPEHYRVALILCHLESRTCDEAARQLGCSARTVKRRLELARRCLHARLARRGLTLSAALMVGGLSHAAAQAALSPTLTAAAVKAAAGSTQAATVSALADGVVRAMLFSRVRTAAVVILTGASLVLGTLVHQVQAQRGSQASAAADPPPLPARPQEPAPASPPRPAARDSEARTIVTGRVLGHDGKPVVAADVAVVGRSKQTGRGGDLLTEQTQVLGQGRTDALGTYRLTVARLSSERFWDVHLLARAAGHGLVFQKLSPNLEKLEAVVTLPPERAVRGRLVDLLGQPAAGVTVRVSRVGKQLNGMPTGVLFYEVPRDLAAWPPPAVSDAQGRFVLRGLGEMQEGFVRGADDRFAPFWASFGPVKDGKEINHALAPAQLVEGQVLQADTGKPLPHALLTVFSSDEENGSYGGLGGRADASGRFRINANPGKWFTISAHPPVGEPYLAVEQRFKWETGKVSHRRDLKLPRGVLVRGKVTEAASGKPIAGAAVQFYPRRVGNPNLTRGVITGWQGIEESGADGTFRIAVLPGPGHLLINGPTGDYIHEEIGDRVLDSGKPGGTRYYPDALVQLDFPAKSGPQDVAVKLRRGVTVKGKLVGPDGQAVTGKSLMICRLNVTALSPFWRFPVEVRDGRFELHGLDPDKSYPVSFLEPERHWGATVQLSGKQAGAAVAVRLQPCGKAVARFINSDGKPAAGHVPTIEIIVTTGALRFDRNAANKGEFLADMDFLANVDRHNYWNTPRADADGRCALPGLIPGMTYRLTTGRGDKMVGRNFTVEPGKTLDLGEINTGQAE